MYNPYFSAPNQCITAYQPPAASPLTGLLKGLGLEGDGLLLLLLIVLLWKDGSQSRNLPLLGALLYLML